MKTRTKRVLGGLAIAAGSLGALGALLIKNSSQKDRLRARDESKDVWARPGMSVTFRAELMPDVIVLMHLSGQNCYQRPRSVI